MYPVPGETHTVLTITKSQLKSVIYEILLFSEYTKKCTRHHHNDARGAHRCGSAWSKQIRTQWQERYWLVLDGMIVM